MPDERQGDLERSGPIATITLRRPEVRNALDLETWDELRDHLATVRRGRRLALMETLAKLKPILGGSVPGPP